MTDYVTARIRTSNLQLIAQLTNPTLLRRVEIRAVARASRDIQRLYKGHVARAVRQTTARRTGKLRRVTTKARRRQSRLTINPVFRATQYRTGFGRGRPGASKIGQYAFVVNQSGSVKRRTLGQGFIEVANRRTIRDRALADILQKHFVYVFRQVFPFIM